MTHDPSKIDFIAV